MSWLRTSRLGSAMLAVRADERSAAAAGINVVRIKLIGFAISAFIAGIGGSLLAYQLSNVTFQDFDAFLGLVLFSVAVVAGITSVSGGIVAGIITSGGLLVTWISSGVGQSGVSNWYGVVAGSASSSRSSSTPKESWARSICCSSNGASAMSTPRPTGRSW